MTAGVLSIAVQVVLLVVVTRHFNLESDAFLVNMMPLAVYGFLTHALLPIKYRLPFFGLLSVGAVIGVLGTYDGVWLVAVGLVLIGICHLPISFSLRIACLVSLAALLGVLRIGWLTVPWSGAVWPVLGSLFMFRLIIYVYDLRQDRQDRDLWRTVSYFFLLPNVIFPFFPVVDYSTFRKTHYDIDHLRIYQRGVEGLLRGVLFISCCTAR